MKKLSLIVLIILGLAALAAISGLIWWTSAKKAPGDSEEEVRVVIPKGSSVESIGNILKDEGVIKSSLAFKIYTQTKDVGRRIPPGEFSLPQNLTLSEIIDELLKGPDEIWVTIPEGFRREQVVETFIESLGLTGSEAETFRRAFLNHPEAREGFLFPDTYLVPKDVTAPFVVSLLRNTFDQKFENTRADLTLNEVVTLASIIERETITEEERPVVAGIFMNRLAINMALQADATVQYALGEPGDWWPQSLTRDQITGTDSRFNTYLYPGIPPAPIANPGLDSLNAVLNPVDSDYFYYIHDASGQIHYAENLEQHNENIANYLR